MDVISIIFYYLFIFKKANLEFSNEKYAESLALYKQALKIKPNLPGSIRLGLAYNFYFLK